MALAPQVVALDSLEARVRAMLVVDPARGRETAKALVLEVHRMRADERIGLLRRRMRAIASLSEGERRAYFALRFAAGRELAAEVDMMEMRAMEDAIASLPPELRGVIRRTKEEVLRGLGLGFPAVTLVSSRGVPYHHDFPMDRRGLRSRHYVCPLCGYVLEGPA